MDQFIVILAKPMFSQSNNTIVRKLTVKLAQVARLVVLTLSALGDDPAQTETGAVAVCTRLHTHIDVTSYQRGQRSLMHNLASAPQVRYHPCGILSH